MNFDENPFGQLWPDNLEPLNKLSNKSPNFLLLFLSVILEKVFLSGHVGMKLLMLCYVMLRIMKSWKIYWIGN